MPASVVASFAKRAGIDPKRAEHMWRQAKSQVTKEYGVQEPSVGESGDKFYRLTVGILKKMMRIKEDLPAFAPLVGAATDRDLRDLGFGDVADTLKEVLAVPDQSSVSEGEVIQYKPDLKIQNLDSLPRGTGAKYLECIRSHNGDLIAKGWKNQKPEKFDVLVKFGR